MSRPHGPLPELLHRPVFAAPEALAAGVTRRRLQSSDLVSLRRGLVAPVITPYTAADVCRALLREHDDAVAVGLTAARGVRADGARETGREDDGD